MATGEMEEIRAVTLIEGRVRIIDQRRLPERLVNLDCTTWEEVAEAISNMAVRGAPAIGIAAGFGVVLAAFSKRDASKEEFLGEIERAVSGLGKTRPTAVNLFWALERMLRVVDEAGDLSPFEIALRLEREALEILHEDIRMNERIGNEGKGLIRDGDGVLTHCNAGALATGGFGTALGVMRAAWRAGKRFTVYVDETRPLLQGARLTAWELVREGIPVRVVADNMAGHLMRRGLINIVFVGADRIAANGDTANKIGTYGVAVLAKEHRIPFFVVAPSSTVDMSTPSGDSMTIEERGEEEMEFFAGKRVVPDGAGVLNPAFDITPVKYITGIITDRGIVYPPIDVRLKTLFGSVVDGSAAGGSGK